MLFRSDERAAAHHMDAARALADGWMTRAADGDHTRLAFDRAGTWSLKYNLIWDRYFGFGLFPDDLFATEASWYVAVTDVYGTPLDSRSNIGKADWISWVACFDETSFERLIDPLWRMLHESPSRVPFTDCHFTDTGRQRNFQNRSTVGAVWMRLLLDAVSAGAQ